jgi:carbamoyltransferase
VNILGLNFFYHDSSACIVKDGQLIVALEEERFTRQKHTYRFPEEAVARCLQEAGMKASDIDAVAVSVKPELDWGKRALHIAKHLPRSRTLAKYELKLYYDKKTAFSAWMARLWPSGRRPEVHWVPHHASHAAGSFYVSPYESAAILSIDGSGEWATAMLGVGRGNVVETFSTSYFPHSIGSVYEAVTQFCGFQNSYDEGKTMGLAPLGDPAVYRREVADIIRIDAEGRIEVDTSYFAFQYWENRIFSDRFVQTFGTPRPKGKGPFEQRHLDVAAAFQELLEERCLEMARILRAKTKERYLVIAGGVALNSVMNGRLVRESGFDDLYVMPGAGDNGTAIGAAYVVYNGIKGKARNFHHADPYVGTSYTHEEITKVIAECKLSAEYHEDIAAATARELHAGQIVCWFQGRMEIGPRALGSRSILANPTLAHMKDKVNAEVKHREAFRPFAPSAIVEVKEKYFDMTVEDPFMLKVCNVLPEAQALLPAITHVDGTARLQTVRRESNPLYYDMIAAFGKLSGVPVVLNTSFNIMGEPIVESPLQAIRCFFSTGLDVLVLGNYLIRK